MPAPTPTTVTLANGTSYTIPAGEPGTYAWVRQASLIAVAYSQVGNTTESNAWRQEYDKRLAAWQAIAAGRDRLAVLAQFGKDLLTAPLKILADIGNTAIDLGKKTTDTLFDWGKWLPWLVFLALIVIGVGLYRGSVRVRR